VAANDKTSGKLIVLVAPSGAGKTSIAQKLLNEFPKLRFSTSATTRPPRNNEQDGVDYFFLSEKEFDNFIKNNQFLEWEQYSGYRYGSLRREVDHLLKKGYFPLFDIEVRGALNLKKMYDDDCASIFIKPPSVDELKRRLERRGSENKSSIEKRVKRAKKELAYANCFDYVIINQDFKTAYKEVRQIVASFITAS
jgi:guanylate kinase